MLVFYIYLTGLMLCAVIWDLKTGRIPNWLNLAGTLISLILSVSMENGHGIVHWFVGFIALFGIGFVLYEFHVIGAGDGKLFAVLGGSLGLKDGLFVLVASLFVAAIPACVMHLQGKKKMRFAWPMGVAVVIWFIKGRLGLVL